MEQDAIDWTGIRTRRVQHKPATNIFVQGDPCATVSYVEQGSVRLSVVSHAGKEAVVALLGPGHFFGEGCLAGQPSHIATATAVTACTIVEVDKQEFRLRFRGNSALAERFLFHMLTRNLRIEADLIDHLFNDAEKRLARTLLLMARFGEEAPASRVLPRVSQTILAEMVGTTRPRVNGFMTKFRKLGFIEYNGTLRVNHSLLTVLLREAAATASGAETARGMDTVSRAGAKRRRSVPDARR